MVYSYLYGLRQI